MNSKSWYASKVVWFNLVTILVAVAAYFGWTPDESLTVGVASFLAAVGPIVNLGLRFLTNKPITGTAGAME